jgi:hypothetical protein
MQIHQQLSGGKPNPKDMGDDHAISDEFSSNFRYQDEIRGRFQDKQLGHIQKNQSSPSKMFKQYNPTTKSPYRGHGMMIEKQSTDN